MEENMKVAIVTGGSNGIGKRVAWELSRRGISVLLTYHANKSGAEDLASRIERDSGVKAAA
jgi:NAD(P)-dependent dehydrogenase (short-subunit alcohol dehydrogenase family)